VEKTPAVGRNPSTSGELPFHISIPANKEALACKAKNAMEEIQVFTDGSAQDGKVGAAAILIRKNRPNRMLHFHLGLEAEYTVHEAKLVGLLLAMHLIGTEQKGATSCSIVVDNQATLRAFNSELRKPGHHLAHKILQLANRMQKCRSKHKYSLLLRWTAGHISIPGNKLADSKVKRAAASHTTSHEHLPPYLRKPLLINPLAVIRKQNDDLKIEWKREWLKTEKGKRTLQIDDTTPSTKFLKMISNPKLSRAAASRIVQLRLQHILLNSYLHKFQRTDKANCPACRHERETIAHYLLHCTKYDYERWALAEQARKRKKDLTLETLLGDPEMALPLANYVDGTARFKINSGERI